MRSHRGAACVQELHEAANGSVAVGAAGIHLAVAASVRI
jgi:hypothetical protein